MGSLKYSINIYNIPDTSGIKVVRKMNNSFAVVISYTTQANVMLLDHIFT